MSAARTAGSAASHGGEDGDRVALVHPGLHRAEVPDILAVQVDVDEAVELAVAGDDLGPDPRVPPVQVIEDVGQGRAVAGDLGLAGGVPAEA
jgi:hypothetical protein